MGRSKPRIPLRSWRYRTPWIRPVSARRHPANWWRHRSGFWGFSTPLHSPSHSLSRSSTQGRIGTPCVPVSGHHLKRASNDPEPSRHTSFTRLTQVPAAAKRASRPASDHHCLRTSPVPYSRFRPTRSRGRPDSPNPQVPTAPRHPASTANPAAASTQPGRALFVAAVSPDGCTAHSTAVAVVPSTPRSATTDLRPHPSTRQARIQA